MSRNQKNNGLVKYEFSRIIPREAILFTLSSVLMKSRKTLWYLETLVLSARYFQKLRDPRFVHRTKNDRFISREKLWKESVIPYLESRKGKIHVAEFGVASGRATQWWHDHLANISIWDGFDTFEGLPDAWTRGDVIVMNKGVFAPKDVQNPYPIVLNTKVIKWHRGLINETIVELERNAGDDMFILIDVDLLEPARDVLRWTLTNGRKGDCIYFDEAFDPFNEGLALSEAMNNGLSFEVLGYTGSALAIVLT